MKKRLLASFLVILSLALTGSYAGAAEKTGNDKIGFVDIRQIMLSSSAGKKASDDMKSIYEKNKSLILESETELKKLKDELEKQRAILTETALKEKENAYNKKLRDYQLLVKDANDDLQTRDQEISKMLIPEILKVVDSIGQREKYTMILDVSAIPIAFYTKENDLTKKVIEEFNKTYKPKK